MATYFLHGLENSLGVWSRYRRLEDTNLRSLNIPLPLAEETKTWILDYINPFFKEAYQIVMFKNALDPLQFCTSSNLINHIFIPILPLFSPVLSHYAKKDPQVEEIRKNLGKICIAVHLVVAIYFLPTEKKFLSVGLLAGHFIGFLKPEKDSQQYDFFLFLLQAGSSLYLGSLFDKGVKIMLLLINYPEQFNQVVSWIQQQFFKPKKDV
ncbi:MAG: hypothetical protein K940chlam8_01281 [Chlamydiae bacterium]|nr:hypothetical protein [Chlamydiota bacterium]